MDNQLVSISASNLAAMGCGSVLELEKHVADLKRQVKQGNMSGVVEMLVDQMVILHGVGITFMQRSIQQVNAKNAARYAALALKAFAMADQQAKTVYIMTGKNYEIGQRLKSLVSKEVKKELTHVTD